MYQGRWTIPPACDLGALVDLGARRRLLARLLRRREAELDHHLRELGDGDGPVAVRVELGEELLDLVRVDLLGRAAQQDRGLRGAGVDELVVAFLREVFGEAVPDLLDELLRRQATGTGHVPGALAVLERVVHGSSQTRDVLVRLPGRFFVFAEICSMSQSAHDGLGHP